MKNLSQKLAEYGLPIFWQYLVAIHFIFISALMILADPFWTNLLNIILKVLTSVGVIGGFIINKQKLLPWIFLVSAVIIVALSVILQSLNYFGLNLAPEIPYWIEQFGILFIVLFGINILFIFENQNNLKGFTIDYTLLFLSGIFLFFLISPDYLNTFLYEQSIYLQISLLHLLIAIGIIALVVLNFVLIPSIQFKDIVLFFLVLSIGLHFFVESSITLSLIENSPFNKRLSWVLYQFAGSFAIVLIFVEKLDLKFVSQYTNRTGTFFLWVASILALTVIPIGAIYRLNKDYLAINPIFIFIASLLLSVIVILRFTVFIKKSNKHSKKLMNIALMDPLTGTFNYLGFQEKYSILARKNPLIIIVNIDDFQSINDLYGRKFGNKVLKSLALRLQKQPEIKIVARTSADTFLLYLQSSLNDTSNIYKKIHKNLGIWDQIDNQQIAVPLTFGASHTPYKIEADTHIKQAEKALYIARQKHTSYYLYSNELEIETLHRQELRGILQQAIDYNYLPVHFQPIYNLTDGSLKAIELLIRIQSKEHGLLLPGQFLEQAQSYGYLTSLTKVCLRMVARNIDRLPNVTININVPSFILKDELIFIEFLLHFKRLNLSPKRFCIEVLEDEKISAEDLLKSTTMLKKEGFSIAMDDFGTGYSTLSRLSILPFDTVKIDRSLLLAASSGNKTILESTITLIKRLGISAVVEGVETIEQLSLIRHLGADSVQGFLLSKPVDINKAGSLPLNAANIIKEF